MQSIQVHLSGASRSWMKKLPEGSIDNWETFEDLFDEYEASTFTTNYDVLPDGGRSLREQAFDTSKNSKEVQIHPTDPKKTTSIASDLDNAQESALIEFVRVLGNLRMVSS
ncbi:hypothetical protein QYE76_005163 [Lolium multiflorum]|uniref:Retrotransposon gag domain-containing protein n=1 Tax=Lolium multiflorum TaxID=4521 RepID=A0AAD8RTC6_LOLMU|nr:hypothetical protein QYE76_005163 [Lolium multiflorum]